MCSAKRSTQVWQKQRFRLILLVTRMNDRLAKAIIRLMNERKELKQALDEIAEAEDL